MPDKSEIQIQTLFRSRARIQCPAVAVIAIPNGGRRTQWALNQAMREGLQIGFPDCICLAPGKIAFIEFKNASGRLSKNQTEWIERLHAMGFAATVSCDPDDALQFLRENEFPFLNEERGSNAI